MANYYELIKVDPSANQAEIEQAIDAQYNQWRRLVTHHDPATADKANRALRTLETIRATLTDPDKRAVYDAAVGIGGATGGLIDPSLLAQTPVAPAPPPPGGPGFSPPPPRAAQPNRPSGSPDAWVCGKCSTENRPGTRYCTKCGQALGMNCPRCGSLVEAAAVHCSECGVNIADERGRQEMEQRAQREREEAAARMAAMPVPAQAAPKKRSTCGVIAAAGAVMFGLVMCVSVVTSLNLFGGSSPRTNTGSNPSVNRPALADTATLDPFAQGFIGENIKVRVWLNDLSAEQIRIDYEIENASPTNFVVSLLTSDISLVDDLGNTYRHAYDTRPIQQELGSGQYDRSEEFQEVFNGPLSGAAKSLTVKFAQISDERDISLVIPLAEISDEVQVEFEFSNFNNHGFYAKALIRNTSAQPFAGRFSAASVSATDNLGNHYQLVDRLTDEVYGFLLSPGSDYGSEEQISWQFEPAAAPGAGELTITIADFMGRQYQETFSLGVIQEGVVRLEAETSLVWEDIFYVDLNIFNLSQETVIIRLDSANTQVVSGDGQTFYTRKVDDPIEVVMVGAGNTGRIQFYLEGAVENLDGLTLVIPMISGVADVEIPIAKE